MAEYLQLAAAPRQSDRAKAHLVTSQELDKHGIFSKMLFDTNEITPSQLNIILHILLNKHADLRRGDIIFVQPQLGYRNDGKYIYDGEHILELADEPDDYGTIPEEFQAGEFPPMYWVNLIVHNSYIPFNVAHHLPNLNINNVKVLPENNGEFCHLFIPFNINGKKLAIINADRVICNGNDLAGLANDFIEQLKYQHYFDYYNPSYMGENPFNLAHHSYYKDLLIANYEQP